MSNNIKSETPELDYLRFVYQNLDLDTLLPIHKRYQGLIPEEYKLIICQDCEDSLAQYMCVVCSKILCLQCTYSCSRFGLWFCRDHIRICTVCEKECVCQSCRKYSSEYTCNTCSDNFEIGFICEHCVPKNNKCLVCMNRIDQITKERT